MSLIQQEFLSFSVQSAFQSLTRFSQIVLDSADQATQLNIKTSRALLNGGFASGQNILGTRNVQEFRNLSQPLIAQTLNYSRALLDITSKAQESLGKLAENQYSEIRQSIDGLLERAAEASPSGTGTGLAVAKSILSSANQAVDSVLGQFSEASKQANSIVGANLDSIRELAENDPQGSSAGKPASSATSAAAGKAAASKSAK
ncbi:MAG: phasin family protein [Zoogloeaceae bacterium]|jgi:phasin family protein|nr:phasin family protein [Zoogloeaceae bacterium]